MPDNEGRNGNSGVMAMVAIFVVMLVTALFVSWTGPAGTASADMEVAPTQR
jgi:hypothetical protein